MNAGPAVFWLQYCDIISLQKSLLVGEIANEIAKVHLFRSASWRNWTYCRIAIGDGVPSRLAMRNCHASSPPRSFPKNKFCRPLTASWLTASCKKSAGAHVILPTQ
jgi:hypothetical protein